MTFSIDKAFELNEGPNWANYKKHECAASNFGLNYINISEFSESD